VDERAAALPIDLPPQYSYPSTFLGGAVRSPTSGTGSTTSSADASHSGGYAQSAPLSPVYDPVTGIVYYPHVPPGASLPAGAVQGAVPGHLLPLPTGSGHQRSPSFPMGGSPPRPTSRTTDRSRTAAWRTVATSAAAAAAWASSRSEPLWEAIVRPVRTPTRQE
jgi:hypothetical protein